MTNSIFTMLPNSVTNKHEKMQNNVYYITIEIFKYMSRIFINQQTQLTIRIRLKQDLHLHQKFLGATAPLSK